MTPRVANTVALTILNRWNQAWDQATIRLHYEERFGTYVAADPISEDRLRNLIVSKRFDQSLYDGVLRLASQAGYCLETEQEDGTMELFVEAVSDEVKAQFVVTDLKPRARKHKLYRIEVPDEYQHTIEGNHTSIIGPIDRYAFPDGRTLVIDRAWRQRNAHVR
jgi:hypothetical protein